MVAAVVGVADLALEAGERTRQDRAAGVPGFVSDPRPLVLPRLGEALGQRALALAQDVDREALGREKRAQAVGAPVEAEQDEWRVEGDRVERAGRDPDRFAPRVEAAGRRAGGPGLLRLRI